MIDVIYLVRTSVEIMSRATDPTAERLTYVPEYAELLARVADEPWPACVRACKGGCEEPSRRRPSEVAVEILAEMSKPAPTTSPAVSNMSSAAADALGGIVPVGCQGAHVDLDGLSACRCTLVFEAVNNGRRSVRAGAWCGASFDGAIDPRVSARLSSRASVVDSGGTLDLELSLRNQADANTSVRLAGSEVVSQFRIFDASHKDVTTPGACGHGASGARHDHLIVLAPAEEASAHVRWSASHLHGELRGANCVLTRRPLPAGTYRLVAKTSLEGGAGQPITAEITIRVR